MVGNYPVSYAQENVGQVLITRNGLYYRIMCNANLPSGRFVKLYAVCQQQRIDIGFCLAEQNHYTLYTNKPIKYFSSNQYSFILEDRKNRRTIPIHEHTPFPHIDILKFCRFLKEDGKIVAFYEDERIRIDY